MDTSIALDFRAFAFIISLAAVVNGLGIVQWVTALSEYLRRAAILEVQNDWIYFVFAGYQFLLHILLWWMFWSVREAANFNFLTYLYLLAGPVLLFFGTSLLKPDIESGRVDMQGHFTGVRVSYANVLVLFWLWALGAGPVLRGVIAPTAPLLLAFLGVAIALRFANVRRIQAACALFSCVFLVTFIALFAMQLGQNVAA